jgi:tetratricopeptide (TPR) repeat protein
MACTSEKSRLIGEFATGRIGAADAERLLEHLDSCPLCSAEFDLVADLVAVSPRAGSDFPVPRQANLFLRGILAAAAAALLIATVWWIADQGEDHRHRLDALAMIEPLPAVDAVLRSGKPPGENADFKAAMTFYSKSDFNAAAKGLAAVVERDPENTPALLYLGISRLQSGEVAAALQPLKRAAELGEHLLQERALWYLGSAYLLTGDGNKALVTFITLERKKGDYELNAREIIAKIREALEE